MVTPLFIRLGISDSELSRELMTPHEHDFSRGWGLPGRCMCGGWEELVVALEATGLPARRMSMDPLLRQSRAIARASASSSQEEMP